MFLAQLCINTYQIKTKHNMKKLIAMVALAAISFGSAYAYAGSRVEKMQTDTTKKSKADTTKKKPPVMKLKK